MSEWGGEGVRGRLSGILHHHAHRRSKWESGCHHTQSHLTTGQLTFQDADEDYFFFYGYYTRRATHHIITPRLRQKYKQDAWWRHFKLMKCLWCWRTAGSSLQQREQAWLRLLSKDYSPSVCHSVTNTVSVLRPDEQKDSQKTFTLMLVTGSAVIQLKANLGDGAFTVGAERV